MIERHLDERLRAIMLDPARSQSEPVTVESARVTEQPTDLDMCHYARVTHTDCGHHTDQGSKLIEL